MLENDLYDPIDNLHIICDANGVSEDIEQTQKPQEQHLGDELDFIGGFVIKLIKSFVSFYRNLFKNQ